ncbi:UBC-like protein, partial [Zopfia rhizophila CBS 207.26]
WKIVMQGPPESAYANGTFLLYPDMGDDYLAFPLKGRFVTPIYHPNINHHRRICHSILDRNWTVDTTNEDVIDTVVPEFSDP